MFGGRGGTCGVGVGTVAGVGAEGWLELVAASIR